ncbi:hypothetical protein G3T36_02095 [Diaminobutyricibacter tongyongensis]|uniref:Uncharacterized protein n=1 Tax=Leifsonia tongyongensis TaxID=1268043 RepID=A0A6L9XTB7_9MICO|nr:hypothetical protein [Diaminobutyricibacter tongyongensis]NEN04652.1 hypothetical protein [Diaminobutyricibacter tongyongensis]
MLAAAVPLFFISFIGVMVSTQAREDEYGHYLGPVAPGWAGFFATLLVLSLLSIVMGIFVFFFRMAWVVNKAANIDLERRLERQRIAAAKYQEYKNANGPAYWQGRLDRANEEAARRAAGN